MTTENKQAAGLDLEALRHRYRLDGRAYDADALALVDRHQALEGELAEWRTGKLKALDWWQERVARADSRAETAEAALSEALAREEGLRKAITAMLCEDCPPIGYPTDNTRCEQCPRRAGSVLSAPSATVNEGEKP